MAARRCSQCNANWANTDNNKECPACGTATWIVNPDLPDRTYAQEQEARTRRAAWATTDGPPTEEIELPVDALQQHRRERFLELGFTEVDAGILSVAKDAKGFYLWWGHVKARLDQGCTHAQAVAIWT